MHYLPGFASKLIDWYEVNKRDLPWRRTTDPYSIWLSEIIMQQTRVQQGLPYYERFITKFPSVWHLANASEEAVLREWQGLGYYSRARNMLVTARQITDSSQGAFPDSFYALLKLKGVGRYTAAAIASFAFGEKVPVVDGNVLRVLTRIFGIAEDISLSSTLRKIEDISLNHISKELPGTYNQAIMEFGATLCVPVKPDCPKCIFKTSCFAYNNQLVNQLPLKIKKLTIRKRFFHYFIFSGPGTKAMKQRTAKDIWTGLYEFFLFENKEMMDIHELEKVIGSILETELKINDVSDTYTHILSHQKLTARFYQCEIAETDKLETLGYKFYSDEEIEILPKPVLILKYINKQNFL